MAFIESFWHRYAFSIVSLEMLLGWKSEVFVTRRISVVMHSLFVSHLSRPTVVGGDTIQLEVKIDGLRLNNSHHSSLHLIPLA